MFIKKGAMFGLDARIALAIFGALSVISGAALYSAIDDSKKTAFMVQLEEFSKAYTAYYLDVGHHVPVYEANKDFLVGNRIVENIDSDTNWNGPYWPEGYGKNRNNKDGLGRVSFRGDYSAGFVQAIDTDWGDYAGSSFIGDCIISNCHIWAYVEVRDKNINFAKDINNRIEKDDSASSGKVRVRYFGDNSYNIYYYVQPK
ncbi:MAG: hypothetical protein CFH44_00585 [Proteobacteria bacterium]|nr:MAG: hypothetical protein CFH44_00585 [Pseudomonadota bacterium]|tara:strand:+ start:328 stop:930 length:603 start_codon:yes stop_codon:yes gene_type:complete